MVIVMHLCKEVLYTSISAVRKIIVLHLLSPIEIYKLIFYCSLMEKILKGKEKYLKKRNFSTGLATST